MISLIAVLFSLNLQFKGPDLFTSFMILPFSIINGLVIASMLHNAAHSNFPTKLLNRVVGEYCGYWVLYGFTNFSLVHLLHHKYSDSSLDPVNPKGMSFFVFLTAPMRYMIKTTKKYLVLRHGHHADYKHVMKIQVALFHLNLALRLSLWYLILGKSLFLSVYLPGVVSIITVFAHINYVCHQQQGEEVFVMNLNHNLYYKIANFFTMGGYYHRNHHHNMKAFNPMFLNVPVTSVETEVKAFHQSA
jgi:fatty acid desaturase